MRVIRITSEQLNHALRTAPPSVARTLIFMWLSASRHADLLRLYSTNTENLFQGILLQWAHFKSDRYAGGGDAPRHPLPYHTSLTHTLSLNHSEHGIQNM